MQIVVQTHQTKIRDQQYIPKHIANSIPNPIPYKNKNFVTSYRLMSLLSTLTKDHTSPTTFHTSLHKLTEYNTRLNLQIKIFCTACSDPFCSLIAKPIAKLCK